VKNRLKTFALLLEGTMTELDRTEQKKEKNKFLYFFSWTGFFTTVPCVFLTQSAYLSPLLERNEATIPGAHSAGSGSSSG